MSFLEHSEIPHKLGKINGLQKFDATFFGINAKQAHSMDPLSRILLEKSYEAIVDAGLSSSKIFIHFIVLLSYCKEKLEVPDDSESAVLFSYNSGNFS